MQTINLSLDLVNGILAYLGSRPFSEVYQLVNQIQTQAQPQLIVPSEEAEESPAEATE